MYCAADLDDSYQDCWVDVGFLAVHILAFIMNLLLYIFIGDGLKKCRLKSNHDKLECLDVKKSDEKMEESHGANSSTGLYRMQYDVNGLLVNYFPIHALLTIVLITLTSSYVLLLADTILTDVHNDEASVSLLYFPYIVGIAAMIMAILICDKLCGYMRLIGFLMLLISTLVKVMLSVQNTQYWTANLLFLTVNNVLYSLLVLIELYIIIMTRKSVNSRKRTTRHVEHVYSHDESNFLSRITWHWVTSFLVQGYSLALELTDLGNLPQNIQSCVQFEKFKHIYQEEGFAASKSGREISLLRCYWHFSRPIILLTAILKLLADNLLYIGAIGIEYVVLYAEKQLENETIKLNATSQHLPLMSYFDNGYIICLFITLAMLLQATLNQNFNYLCAREGIQVKAALQSLVYSKSLRLSEAALTDGRMSHGEVLNHMSTDILNVFMFFYMGHYVWTLPIQISVALILLYHQLGLSALISGLIIVCMVPMQYLVGQAISTKQAKVMHESDERLMKCNELLHNMKLIKLYSWEVLFSRAITAARNRELFLLLQVAILRIVSLCICDISPIVACVLTFTLHGYLSDVPLTGGKVFSSLALFGFLAMSLYIITIVINVTSFGIVSTRRISKFLNAQEIHQEDPSSVEVTIPSVAMKNMRVSSTGSMEVTIPSVAMTNMRVRSTGSMEVAIPTVAAKHMRVRSTGSMELFDMNSEASTDLELVEVENGFPDSGGSDLLVQAEDASFTWLPDSCSDSQEEKTVLHDLTFKIAAGDLFMICGPVGSGKTSLLSAVLGEMYLDSGRLYVDRAQRAAYVPQRAWLVHATIKENILFGEEFDLERYQEVLNVCDLIPDLKLFIAGDQTEIGEKGVNLSGGQKQRISIARAVYSKSSIVILDDPLSALDAPVANHIFHKAILGTLHQSGKSVILVTHQLHFLEHADQVLCLQNGHISFLGPPKKLKDTQLDFLKSLKHEITKKKVKKILPSKERTQNEVCVHKSTGHLPVEKDLTQHLKRHLSHDALTPGRNISHTNILEIDVPVVRSLRTGISRTDVLRKQSSYKEPQESDFMGGQLIEEEEHNIGAVKWPVYRSYIRAATWILVILTIVMYMIREGLHMTRNYWINLWVEAIRLSGSGNSTASINDSEADETNLEYYVTSYLIISAVSALISCLSYTVLEVMALMAAKHLHHNMLQNIICAPLRFFDTTPVGRILNRMSGDMQIIDQRMPVAHDIVLYCSYFVLGGIIMNAVATPYFLLPALVMFVVYLLIQRFYIRSARELQRLDSISKSPILTHFTETLSGLSSIRAYQCGERMLKKMWQAIDTNNLAFLFMHTTFVWMGIRLDYLGALLILTASIFSLTSCLHGHISPEMVGLSISYAVTVSTFINWAMRSVSELEMWFNSVQRIGDYTDIVSEGSQFNIDDQSSDPPMEWPRLGTITYENVSLRYDETLPPVIKDFSVNIEHGQKIGICGRTGSGKSSLTLSMFSLLDICEGRIVFDGYDIKKVPLHRLRSSIAIIPQDPVLFSGTIRYNLDPTNEKSDTEIWQALEISQVKDTVSVISENLDSRVSQGGENFSVGQRQLFCLARAVLRNSQILIMDEATASMDVVTDEIIQKVIKTTFAHRTVIIIAHRISTIMNCDKVLVIEDGRLLENDKPANLLSRDSKFAAMAAQHQL